MPSFRHFQLLDGIFAARQSGNRAACFLFFFQGESVPVNQKLSDMFLQLHISERSGRGVPKIVEAYGRVGGEEHEDGFTLFVDAINAYEHATASTPGYITAA